MVCCFLLIQYHLFQYLHILDRFQDRIAPWVHYIPVQADYSDLYDALVFFRGDLKGDGGHDAMAKKIAAAGRKWSKTFWRREDMTAYMFRYARCTEHSPLTTDAIALCIRLYLEYARVMSLDREAMTYQG